MQLRRVVLEKRHHRPILCCAVHPPSGLGVTGSADHGLRVWDLRSQRFVRELHAKAHGHSDWVTAVAFSRGGRVVSGGSDGKICVWGSNSATCVDLCGHRSSISKLVVDTKNVCMSAAYDGSLRIWDIDAATACATLSGKHDCPVTEFAWTNSLAVSGGKDGRLVFWDLNSGKAVYRCMAHKGVVGYLKFGFRGDCGSGCGQSEDGVDSVRGGDSPLSLLSIGKFDGQLAVHDLRRMTTVPLLRQVLHRGAVSVCQTIIASPQSGGGPTERIERLDEGCHEYDQSARLSTLGPTRRVDSPQLLETSSGALRRAIVTGGADRAIRVWDMDAFFEATKQVESIQSVALQSPVLCGAASETAFCAGCGDGRVFAGGINVSGGGEDGVGHEGVRQIAAVDKTQLITLMQGFARQRQGREELAVFAGGDDGVASLFF